MPQKSKGRADQKMTKNEDSTRESGAKAGGCGCESRRKKKSNK